MEITDRLRRRGIYLVVDPSMEEKILLKRLQQALQEKILAVQIWDNFNTEKEVLMLANKICELSHASEVPVFINNRWELLADAPLDGVHFDEIPQDINRIRGMLRKEFLCGLTCNNDLKCLDWAEKHQFDYISFCSIFPSTTSNSCELVDFETIREAKERSSLPIFLAGGINPENMEKLNDLKYEGIAVVSGIMNADNPGEAVQNYMKKLNL
ncbi:thiamine phosphate synthase [Salegentibacter sp. F14]